MPWGLTPLYAVLHESIYCQGAASAWAAERVRESEYKETFDAVRSAEEGRPVLFTGLMHSWGPIDEVGLSGLVIDLKAPSQSLAG